MSFWGTAEDEGEVFGPGTDLTLSLVGVLALLLFVVGHQYLSALRIQEAESSKLRGELEEVQEIANRLGQEVESFRLQQEQVRIELAEVERKQLEFVDALAIAFRGKKVAVSATHFAIDTAESEVSALRVDNEATLQRISFGNHLLFRSDEHLLLQSGKEALGLFVSVLQRRLDDFKEIQIQGHADPRRTVKYATNLNLAAQRALEVFEYLRGEGGIDPARHLMSATSFGEFSPVARRDQVSYNREILAWHNSTASKRKLNRRIEIVLIYRARPVDGA